MSPFYGSFPLVRAPHRLFFFAGILLLMVALLFWSVNRMDAAGLLSMPQTAWPAGWIHVFLIAYGALPFFMGGFLLTAMPRWQNYPELTTPDVALAWSLLVFGWLAIGVGFFCTSELVSAGCFLLILGWLLVLRLLWKIARHSHPNRLHAHVVSSAATLGLTGFISWFIFSLNGHAFFAIWAIQVGMWLFLAPIFLTVCHRMIPFFSQGVLAPYVVVGPGWALGVLLGSLLLHVTTTLFLNPAWAWPANLVGAAVAFWLSLKWQWRRSLAVPLLGMLHIGFGWLGVGLLLLGVQNTLWHFTGHVWLGLAPMHALSLGFFLSLTYAMVSRVSLGHSGNPLRANPWMWYSFLMLQLAICLRLFGEFFSSPVQAMLNFVSVAMVCLIFMIWAFYFLPIYLRTRRDGKPG